MSIQGSPVGFIQSGGASGGGGGSKQEFFAGADYNANYNMYRTRSLGPSGAQNFSFQIPVDFVSLVSCVITGFSNDDNPAAPIDYISEYCAVGELFNNHTQSQIGGTEAILTDTRFEFDISGVLSFISAGDIVGLDVDHQGISATLQYVGIVLVYQ